MTNPVARNAHKAIEMLTGAVSMSHQFVVFIDHSTYDLGSWSKAAGLSVSWKPIEYRTSSRPNYVWLSPGLAEYSKISLSRAACSDSQTVMDWLATTTSQNTAHRPLSGAIQLIDMIGMPVIEWPLREFFPIGWQIKELDAGSSSVALETLDFMHSGFLDAESRSPF